MENKIIPANWDEQSLRKYVDIIKTCLEELYTNEKKLFANNLCERCIAFRFAYHLQNEFNHEYANQVKKYFVDCDYNNSSYYDAKSGELKTKSGKLIGAVKRFIDIIVHNRNDSGKAGLICFEIKKWNNMRPNTKDKDENNLKILTSKYSYDFGFHLIFGKKRDKVKLKVFKGEEGIDISSRLNLVDSLGQSQ